jgi:hypothetical protein
MELQRGRYAVFISAHGVSLWKMRRAPLLWGRPKPVINQAPVIVPFRRQGRDRDGTVIYVEEGLKWG